MNLHFKNIKQWGDLHRKVKSRRHSWFHDNEDTNGVRVQLFTVDKPAQEESQANLKTLKEFCRTFGVPYLICKPTKIQLVGHNARIGDSDLMSKEFYEELQDNFQQKWYYSPHWTTFENEIGYYKQELTGVYGEALWMRSPQTGFWDIKKDEKITDRKLQIRTLWDLGFISKRGRPITVADERWSGSPEEIRQLTNLAATMQYRKHESEVASKIMQAYNVIHRDNCWPGHW
jgi:hypothetical protein